MREINGSDKAPYYSDTHEEERRRLLEHLKSEGYVRTERVEKAMLSVPRELFVPPINRDFAYADQPLQIKGGQTISAPHMVASMCELAELEPGHKVLEVGAGSGYHAAVIAWLVFPGTVYSTEVVPSLVEEAKRNLRNTAVENVKVIEHDGSAGLKEHAPYDRIIVTCAAPSVPSPLIKQLKHGGIMIIPLGDLYLQVLMKVIKDEKGKVRLEKGMGCVFVPMKGKYGFK